MKKWRFWPKSDTHLGRSPISANLRVLGLYAEGLSRRDSVKVAQYEVLGNDAKKTCPSRKRRSKRSAFGLARRSATASIDRSSRSSFVILTTADRPGRIPL